MMQRKVFCVCGKAQPGMSSSVQPSAVWIKDLLTRRERLFQPVTVAPMLMRDRWITTF